MSGIRADAVFRAASSCSYGYDATGVLVHCQSTDQTAWRFWRGGTVANELRTTAGGDTRLTWLRASGQPVAEQASGAVARLTLLAGATSGSILLETDTAVRSVAYAPHGHRAGQDGMAPAAAMPAYNGEMLDVGSGCYLLGAGHHRPYSPTLAMFLAPDSASPFGAGGLNPLSYCGGDPANRTDSNGHFWKWIFAGIAVVAAVATLGIMAAAGATALTASAIVGAAMITVGAGLEVASAIVKDEKLSNILGIAGAVVGIVGGVAAGAAVVKGAASIKARVARFSQRVGTIRTQGLSGRGAPEAARRMATSHMRGRFRNPLTQPAYRSVGMEDAANARGYAMMDEMSDSGWQHARRRAEQWVADNPYWQPVATAHEQGIMVGDVMLHAWNPTPSGGLSGAVRKVVVQTDDKMLHGFDAPPMYRAWDSGPSGVAPMAPPNKSMSAPAYAGQRLTDPPPYLTAMRIRRNSASF